MISTNRVVTEDLDELDSPRAELRSSARGTAFALVPESAPFDARQRAWLNGFLAGWLGIQPPDDTAISVPDEPPAQKNDHPWHDPSLPLDKRMEMSEGRPLDDRLMSAMAQLDCGTCGYLCHTYAAAIASGSERSLTLCSPGGAETARALKQIMKTAPGAGKPPASVAVVSQPAAPAVGTRPNPCKAVVKETRQLNAIGSAKQTTHVVLDIKRSGATYRPGDSLGVLPTNCPELVASVLQAAGIDPDADALSPDGGPIAAAELLRHHKDLHAISDELLELVRDRATVGAERNWAAALLEGETDSVGGAQGTILDRHQLDVLDVLLECASAQLSLDLLAGALEPLRPRLYSISSSLAAHPGEVHLTVARVTTESHKRLRKGVASTMLADRVEPGSELRVFVQPSHGFALPDDPRAPVIMIGPGTGIAPFRAFLHQRHADQAPGRNWLFFGDQRAATDFLYRDELEAMCQRGTLTRLDTAFSRDQDEKIYVQHRMRERARELFEWIDAGAYIYVCGDARRMAVDVNRALLEIVTDQGRMTEEDATGYLNQLKQTGRYARDVY